ncbi:MAG: protein-L-isoaspartate(D-aspartate) O-methyltransferase [Betaproteobacteria bacterium]
MNRSAAANGGLASARIRDRMVERVRELGVRDARVLDALRAVPRQVFVDPALASRAYEDTALPIGHGQTISQPYIVARTAELALAECPDPKSSKVLEIGTGCGYAAAVLAQLFGTVISIERVRALHELARGNLRPLRIAQLRLAFGDGSLGVPSEAPFDVITAAAAGEEIPPAWIAQLKPGGRIVAPVGSGEQQMTIVSKDAQGRVSRRTSEPVRFVPLRGGTV